MSRTSASGSLPTGRGARAYSRHLLRPHVGSKNPYPSDDLRRVVIPPKVSTDAAGRIDAVRIRRLHDHKLWPARRGEHRSQLRDRGRNLLDRITPEVRIACLP